MGQSTQCLLRAFPVELIVDILAALDFTTLLACKRVCKLFKALIDFTAGLQYFIELYVAGQDDGPSSRNAVLAERLKMLERREAAWDELRWAKEQRVPMLDGHLWELSGGVLAQSRMSGELHFRRLPSVYRSIEGEEWNIGGFGFPVRDFGMDPSQDLLVVIEGPRWSGPNPDHTYRFHLRTMSTGDPHPLAPTPAVFCHVQAVRDSQLSYTLQVSAEHIGILFNSAEAGENELIVWEWKSGKIEVLISGDEIRSFAFLTERHIIMALLSMSDIFEDLEPSLLVLDFKKESNRKHTVEEAEHTVSFSYPDLYMDVSPIKFEIRSDPAPLWSPSSSLRVPFFVARRNKLYAISLWVVTENQLRCVMLFVPLTTFLSCLGNNASDPTSTLEWSEWGPSGTRILIPHTPPSETWVCYIYGSKYAALRREKTALVVDLYDFNQLALSRAMSGGRETDNGTKYVLTPGVFEDITIFGHKLETSLPYRVRSVPLDSTFVSHGAIVCSEDSLIIVNPHVDCREYQILTF